jgi:hypothetical protein
LSLTLAEISALLKSSKTAAPPQFGPLRWFDTEMRCASRGCSSPTVLQLNGIPRCSVHVLRIMNEMLTSEEEQADPSYEDRSFRSGYNGREVK